MGGGEECFFVVRVSGTDLGDFGFSSTDLGD